ncbi:hypothetical protein GLYMA_02G157166v4 [Glycine max]|nr:hypothetical protein GLYMA_02G157166v4 [Glycine max]KAH1060547.1 hypothetical protein GYH30_004152 [Glycine max]
MRWVRSLKILIRIFLETAFAGREELRLALGLAEGFR